MPMIHSFFNLVDQQNGHAARSSQQEYACTVLNNANARRPQDWQTAIFG